MEEHFDRKVVFSGESEFKNLYSWSIHEEDGEGNKVGRDFIPWVFGGDFTANEVSLLERLEVGGHHAKDGVAHSRRYIKAKLQPDGYGRRAPTYSFFGTDRSVKSIDLHIEAISGEQQPTCHAHGFVAYTAEFDFRDETHPDQLTFSVYVEKDVFDHYAERVASGRIEHLSLRLSRVKGFYAEWTPSISTDTIKILASDKSHVVEGEVSERDLHRLGEVDEASITIAMVGALKIAFDPREVPSEDDDEPAYSDPTRLPLDRDGERQRRDKQALMVLTSLRMAAWIIAALLLIALIIK